MKNPFEEECYNELVKEFGKKSVLYEPTRFSYTTKHIYTPDFGVYLGNDVFYVEAKGYLRPDHRRAMLAARSQNPDLDLKIIFQKNQKLGKNTRYSDWAEKNGIDYIIGPKDRFELT